MRVSEQLDEVLALHESMAFHLNATCVRNAFKRTFHFFTAGQGCVSALCVSEKESVAVAEELCM